MVNHMKTTVNIPDTLFRRAKAFCAERAITLTELIQQALSESIEGSKPGKGAFRLADGSFKGELGLQPSIEPSDWTTIRELTYEGRGT